MNHRTVRLIVLLAVLVCCGCQKESFGPCESYLEGVTICRRDQSGMMQCQDGQWLAALTCSSGDFCTINNNQMLCGNPCFDLADGRKCGIFSPFSCNNSIPELFEVCKEGTVCKEGSCQENITCSNGNNCPLLDCDGVQKNVKVCINNRCLSEAWSGSEYCQE